MAAYHPGDRARRLEWEPDENGRHFLGGSSLVKTTAFNYWGFIEAKAVEVDESLGFWGKQGNAAAAAHFSEFTDYQEIQVRAPLALCPTCQGPATGDEGVVVDGVVLLYRFCEMGHRWIATDQVGHIDAVVVYDETGRAISRAEPPSWPNRIIVVLAEHKLQDPGDEDEPCGNVDLARRQVLLYLAWFREQLAAGVRSFPLSMAESAQVAAGKSRSRPLVIPPHCEVAATLISVRHWPRNQPPARVKTECPDEGLIAQVRDRYRRKALAILGGAESALAWDNSSEGLREFKLTLDAQADSVEVRDLAKHVLGYALGLSREAKWGAFKGACSANACSAMGMLGEKKVKLVDPNNPEEVWALPTAKSTAGGRGKTIVPNLRGDWDEARLELELTKLGAQL